jgi:membrane-bound lytic murein transglycosylase D
MTNHFRLGALRLAATLLFASLTIVFFVTGCAHSPPAAPVAPLSDVPKNVPEQGYVPNAHYGNIALDDNPKVDQWIKYFTGRGRKYMHVYLERSARYIPLMKSTFRERGMPDQLAYVALIESGFSPTAFSNASAVGYWQFIRETGKRYNLRIDPYVDERRDPILSTQAAATFLDSLYSIFGDWHLALAAYNAGEQRILSAVMKKRTRNFWELSQFRRVLPKETVNYIPKFIAAVRIAEDPAKYGFTDIDFQPAFTFDSVVVEKPISLETLSSILKVDYDDMKLMNPRYKSDYVPVYNDRVNAVRVPVGMKDQTVAALSQSLSSAPKRFVASFEYYRIRRGETLSHIAKRFHTSVAKLRDLNDLSRRTMIRAGKKIKVPEKYDKAMVKAKTSDDASDSEAAPEKASSDTSSSPTSSRRGVASRAKHNGRTVASNSSRKSTGVVSKAVAKNDSDHRVHVVRRGENLSTIARKYKVTISQIAKANSLTRRSKILAGRELVIPD